MRTCSIAVHSFHGASFMTVLNVLIWAWCQIITLSSRHPRRSHAMATWYGRCSSLLTDCVQNDTQRIHIYMHIWFGNFDFQVLMGYHHIPQTLIGRHGDCLIVTRDILGWWYDSIRGQPHCFSFPSYSVSWIIVQQSWTLLSIKGNPGECLPQIPSRAVWQPTTSSVIIW